jgi:threonine dehydrogenase-like Zn-dependent dehydrogenase
MQVFDVAGSTAESHSKPMERIQKGEINPSFVITHSTTLEQRPEHKTFRAKEDGCLKVVMKPS